MGLCFRGGCSRLLRAIYTTARPLAGLIIGPQKVHLIPRDNPTGVAIYSRLKPFVLVSNTGIMFTCVYIGTRDGQCVCNGDTAWMCRYDLKYRRF